MASSYTSLLGFVLPVTGELSGSWGSVWNDSGTSLIDNAIAGTTTLSTDADVTLTTSTGVSNEARQAIILWNPASGTVTRNITAPAQSKIYTVINASGGTQSIVIRGAGPTTGVTIVKGESAVVAWNGTDFIKISNTGGGGSFTNVTISGTTTLSGLTASTALALNASKEVVSVTNTGTGNNVLSASPTLTGTVAGASLQLSSLTSGRVTYAGTSGLLQDNANLTFNGTDLTVSGAVNAGSVNATTLDLTNLEVTNIKAKDGTAGMQIADSTGVVSFTANPVLSAATANGVVYANGSKVLTMGSALTFDGAKLVNTSGVASALIQSTDTGGTGSFLRMLGDATSGNLINWTTGTALRFATSTDAFGSFSEAMRLTSTGLGIGTSSPDRALSIYTTDTTGKMALFSNGNTNTNLYLSSDPSSGGAVFNASNNAASAGAPFLWQLNGSEQMRLTSTGLGIGTSSPTEKLTVSGNVAIPSNNFYKMGTENYLYSDGSNTVEIAAGTSGKLVFVTNGAQRAALDSSGNLLVGLTSATGVAKLQVSGPLRTTGYTVATLPTGTVGMRTYVTDALAPAALMTVAGGGSVVVPVFYNGTNWIVA